MAVSPTTTTKTVDMTQEDSLEETQLKEYREELEALGTFPVRNVGRFRTAQHIVVSSDLSSLFLVSIICRKRKTSTHWP